MFFEKALEIVKDDEFRKMITSFPELEKLEKDIAEDRERFFEVLEVFPEEKDIFRSFSYFKKSDTRVVIVGQDPYHTPGMATGLSFGISENFKKVPPSLRNINREYFEEFGKDMEDLTLEKWARQGVLMINAAFTVREKSPASHMKFWKKFTRYIIEELKKDEKIVWVAWGAFADKMIGDVERKIISSHPSPLSFKKTYKENPKFFGSKPFSSINNVLKNDIDW